MGVWLSVEDDEEQAGALEELHHWLSQDPEFRGCVSWQLTPPAPSAMGSATSILLVTAGSGMPSALAASLRAFLARPRQQQVRIVITMDNGLRLEITSERLGDAETLLREYLGAASSGSTATVGGAGGLGIHSSSVESASSGRPVDSTNLASRGNRTGVRAADPARSRLVLVGASVYRELPDIPAVANNISDLAKVFTDPSLGGFDVAHCRVATPTANVTEVGELLTQAAEEAEDLLLIYYSGHGLIGRNEELYLGLSNTRPDQPESTAVRYAALREILLESRAANRVVILDSCYSGRATTGRLVGDAVASQLEDPGIYTLASSSANSQSMVLPGERHTALTERLLGAVRTGIPTDESLLSMEKLFWHIHDQLKSRGLPTPQQRGRLTGLRQLALTRNRHEPGLTLEQGFAHDPQHDLYLPVHSGPGIFIEANRLRETSSAAVGVPEAVELYARWEADVAVYSLPESMTLRFLVMAEELDVRPATHQATLTPTGLDSIPFFTFVPNRPGRLELKILVYDDRSGYLLKQCSTTLDVAAPVDLAVSS